MRNHILVGAGLGLVAAVVFASATTGPFVVRLVLFFITPLPIALAGLGWGPRAAITAGVVGTAVAALWAGQVVALAFAATQVVPVVALTYLALLARPSPSDPAVLEWYPPGRLIIWAAVMAGLLAFASLALISRDPETLVKMLADIYRTALKDSVSNMPDAPQISDTDIQTLSEVSALILPGASAVSWMMSLLFNLWLAGRITLASGQLIRPWPDLAAITYPPGSALGFGVALLGASLLSGLAGQASVAFVGALAVPFFLLGLAVVHFTTRGKPWRSFALWALYMSIVFGQLSGVPVVALVVVLTGLAEPVLNLRTRYASNPPSANSST